METFSETVEHPQKLDDTGWIIIGLVLSLKLGSDTPRLIGKVDL